MTTPSAAAHYDADYFAWQQKIGSFVALTNRHKFLPFIRPTDSVLDFGCGGGYLLAALPCRERLGVELNPAARAEAARQGVRVVAATADLPDDCADVLISNSCLEHCEAPLAELRALFPKLRPGGTLVIAVPHESDQRPYAPGDINQHLYTWSPLNLGNCVTLAGFAVDTVRVERLLPPPRIYRQLYALLGWHGYVAVSRLYRWFRIALSPVWPLGIASAIVAVAHRPH